MINIFGLAIGIACCLVIGLFVRDELSFDRFHSNADRIYRIAIETSSSDRTFYYPSVGGGIAPALTEEYPEIERFVRFAPINPSFIVRDNQATEETRLFLADSTVFDIFDFRIVDGSAQRALSEPFNLVLTEEMALKYFGRPDVAGEVLGLEFDGQILDLRITAVLEDLPQNTHFPFDFLVSMTTANTFENLPPGFFEDFLFTVFYSYLLVDDGFRKDRLEAEMSAFLDRHVAERQRGFLRNVFFQPLTSIHLRSHLLNEIRANSDIRYIYVFSAIALLTLVLACVNFMNLATARSAMRAKEVGLRKVLGSQRGDLVRRFLGESLMVTFFALFIGVILAELALPAFNAATDKQLAIGYTSDWLFWVGLLAILVTVGIASGSYPAFFLAKFQPVEVLKGKIRQGMRDAGLRRALVIGQFAITVAFLVGAAAVHRQLNYIQTTDLGFERDHRVVLPVVIDNQDNERVDAIRLLKQAFEQIPGVRSVTSATSTPGNLRQITPIRLPGQSEERNVQVTTISVDHDYRETMGIRMVAGRFFDPSLVTDSTEAFVVNQATAAALGIDDPVGQPIVWQSDIGLGPNTQTVNGQIIGVFENLHYEPLHREISPMMLRVNPDTDFAVIAAVDPRNVPETLAAMADRWAQIVPARAFNYSFLDEDLAQIYSAEMRLGQLVSLFTILALIVACMGLFGLSLFTTQQRTREIGIRKVMGASIPGILRLLIKEFAILILIANLIAWPVAYFLVDMWLDGFAYHVQIGIGLFILSGVMALMIALLTVSYQSIRAAVANPVEALRYE